MIFALYVAILVALGGIGWLAHRAYVRIDAWGRAMNEQDAIVRRVSEEEEIDGALRRVRVLRYDDARESSGVQVAAK